MNIFGFGIIISLEHHVKCKLRYGDDVFGDTPT